MNDTVKKELTAACDKYATARNSSESPEWKNNAI